MSGPKKIRAVGAAVVSKETQKVIDGMVARAIKKGLCREPDREAQAGRIRESVQATMTAVAPAQSRGERSAPTFDKRVRAAHATKWLLRNPAGINPKLLEGIVDRLNSGAFSRAEKSEYIRGLVTDPANKALTAPTLFAKADKSIIGDMAPGTFANRVSAILKES